MSVLVCPTFMLGAYDPRPTSGRLIQQAARSPLRVDTGGGNNFVDVLDVARAMISAAELGRRGDTYILGGQNLPYAELSGLIHQALGRRVSPRLRLPRLSPLCRRPAGGCLRDAHGSLERSEHPRGLPERHAPLL